MSVIAARLRFCRGAVSVVVAVVAVVVVVVVAPFNRLQSESRKATATPATFRTEIPINTKYTRFQPSMAMVLVLVAMAVAMSGPMKQPRA